MAANTSPPAMVTPTVPPRRRSNVRLSNVLLVLAAWTGCVGDKAPVPSPPEIPTLSPEPMSLGARPATEGGGPLLSLELTPTSTPETRPPLLPKADLEPLSADAVEALLARVAGALPPPKESFQLPPAGAAPPRLTPTEVSTFPPKAAAVASPPPIEKARPLTVTRAAPQGGVSRAADVQVQFSEAVVALGARGDSEAQVPLKLEPQPAGRWRYVDPQTLIFEPEGGRLPAATAYRLTVPAGLIAPSGGVLEADFSAAFETRPPEVRSFHPRRDAKSVALRPVLVLTFDQRVDPTAVLAAARLEAGGRSFDLEIPTDAELEADDEARRSLARIPSGQAVALIPTQPLPTATEARLTVEAGPWSAEGPRPAEAPFRSRFSTHGPLQVAGHRCGWDEDGCSPRESIHIEFTNPLDEGVISQAPAARLEPEVRGLSVEVSSSGLYLRGATQARTTYRIVLSPALTDVFGQALGETESLSLEVGPAPPLLTAPGRDLVRLLRGVDAVPFLVAGAESLEVEVRQVKPSDWPAYAKHHRGGMRTPLPGKITFEGQVPVMGDPDRATELSIDVSSALNDGMGHAIVSVKHPGAEHRYPPTVWVAVSNVLLDAWSDSESDLYVLASDPSGAPLVGREIRMGAGGASATTNAEGLARLPLLPERPSRDPWLESKDAAFLPGAAYGGGEVFARRAPGEPRASFLVLDDRGLYRPGETAHLKGFVRRFIADKLETPKAGLQVKARVRGPRGNEWAAKEATLSRYGSFTLDIDVPKDANLGRAHVEIEVPSLGRRARTRHLLRIEEFRRPVFDVSVQLDAPPHVIGEPLSAVARAEAYAGGALSGTPVRWQVHEATAHYAPPGWDGWRFGAESPWWWSFRLNFPRAGSDGATYRVEDVTDASGRSTLKLVPREPKKNLPVSLSVGVEVEDVDRRSVRAQAQALVLPAERTIGLRLEDVFLPAGAPLDLEWVAVDLDGRPSSGSAVSLSLFSRPGYGPVEDEPETSAPLATISALSGTGPDSARFAAPEAPGRYLVRAEVEDASGRRSRTELFAYWSGGADRSPSHVERESLELVPDKERYAVGETATIEVRSPLPEARGAWMVMADGLVRFEPLSLKGGSAQLRIPVTRSMAPDPFVEVWLAGSDPNPVELAGMIPLVVGIDEDKLTVSVRPPAETSPGADTVIELEVKDAQGRPVEGAEITLAVADEAVLALAKRPWPEPLEALIPDRLGYIHELHSRSKLVLVAPSEVSANLETLKLGSPPEAAEMMMRSAGAAPGAAGRDPIDLREDLRPLAYFNPGLITDGEGRVQARFQLPDDLTRWRARAVAASGAQFGRGEAAFVARKPISIEPALPRFLSFGDAPELSFVVANRSDAPQPIELAVTTQGLTLGESHGGKTIVPARSRVEVSFPASADAVGAATVRAALHARGLTDAVQVELPVYAPLSEEAFAEYGSLTDRPLARAVEIPAGSIDVVGGLDIELSSSRILAARDAVRSLTEYPFSCAEQRASRLLAFASLRGLVARFPKGATALGARDLESSAESEIEGLLALRRGDGSWGYWPGAQPNAFLTAHVLHALARAGVPPERWRSGALEALDRLEAALPDALSEASKARLLAHGAFVRAVLGAKPAPRVAGILERAGGLAEAHPETLAWLAGAADGDAQDRLLTALGNRITVTARAAHLISPADGAAPWVLHGNHRADAILLLSLLEARPGDTLIEPLLEGLLAGRRATGAWAHTQENAWALLALARYAEVKEATPPRFDGRAWLGPALVAAETFSGRQGPRATRVPMAWLSRQDGLRALVLAREGEGRLYYRLGLEFAREELEVESLARGFTVKRSYESVDDSDDVLRTEEGWRVRAGARVRIRLEVVSPGPRHHVALVDRLPAGLEPLHAEDASHEEVEGSDRRLLWLPKTWDHQNLRDTGAEAFAVGLAGVRRYTYLARATATGRFRAPPARAEEMYAPETFGRTRSEIVVVHE